LALQWALSIPMNNSLFNTPATRTSLRRDMRRLRRAVPHAEAQRAGRNLLKQLRRYPSFLACRRVAVYLKNDGEIDCRWLIDDLQRRGCEVLLPVLHPLRPGHLSFIRYTRHTPMRMNRFGIAEPDFRYGVRVPARFISLICLPLVAFDGDGNRLGMGGGFYDRTLAFMAAEKSRRPVLAGCAYHFQQVTRLPVESWDIPLQMIVTDKNLIRCSADTGF